MTLCHHGLSAHIAHVPTMWPRDMAVSVLGQGKVPPVLLTCPIVFNEGQNLAVDDCLYSQPVTAIRAHHAVAMHSNVPVAAHEAEAKAETGTVSTGI